MKSLLHIGTLNSFKIISLSLLLQICGEGLAIGATEIDSSSDISPYTVSLHLHGDKDSHLKELLLGVSTAVMDKDNPPPSRILLEAIAEADIKKMEQILRGMSYYAGTVKYNFKEKEKPLRLIFSVTTGKPFLINDITISTSGSELPDDVIIPDGKKIGLVKGQPGTSSSIVSATAKLLGSFRRQGYPFAELSGRRAVVNYAAETIDVSFDISPGDQAVFGEVTIKGLEDVNEDFVLRRIPWKEGQVYNPALIQELRNSLSRTSVFSMVIIPAPEKPDKTAADKEPSESPTPLAIPMRITLRERARYTIGLMAGYSTDLGFGGGVSWEDRNLFGEGELFKLDLFGSEKMFMVEGRFLIPEFLRPDQSLTLSVQPVYDNPDAYTSYRIRGSAVIRRDLSDTFSVSGGAALTEDNVKQLEEEKNFTLFSIPLNAQFSIGGVQPFPRAGALFSLLGEPYLDLRSGRLFVKTIVDTNLLYRFPGADFMSAVGRISFGSILSASPPGEVPADLRFYAGGANSIRGYAYQSVGPLVGKDPVGGRSLLTFSLEFDFQVIGDFGAAAFIDGGSSFADNVPEDWDMVLWGTGAGLRYFTPIGPIGLDIGFPLNKRKGIDEDFQVYVSIAQIF